VRLLPDLRARSTETELLDAGVSDAEARRSLADLRFVNRWLGGRRGLLAAARPHLPPGGRLLEVGCGSADIAAHVAAGVGGGTRAVGADVKLLHLRDAVAGVRVLVGDVRALPFAPGSFDVVTANHFLHHFDAAELEDVVRALLRLARRAVVVGDLHRHRVPHAFGQVFFPALFASRVSVEDGLASIRRGFRPEELQSVLEAAGGESVEVRRVFPFRLVGVATRSRDAAPAAPGQAP